MSKPKPKSKKKTSSKKPRAERQAVMTDAAGETFDLSIPAIDACADAHLRAKKKEADGKLALRQKVEDAYNDLDKEMEKYLDKLPPSRAYTYTAYDGKRKQVKYSKPKITIRNAKTIKRANTSDVIPAANAINPDADKTAVEEFDAGQNP